jgi:hypothetical protein
MSSVIKVSANMFSVIDVVSAQGAAAASASAPSAAAAAAATASSNRQPLSSCCPFLHSSALFLTNFAGVCHHHFCMLFIRFCVLDHLSGHGDDGYRIQLPLQESGTGRRAPRTSDATGE